MRSTALLKLTGAATLVALMVTSNAWATIPYGSVTPGLPALGPGIAPPSTVPGKEYSHDIDEEVTAVGVAPDPKQVIAWDGSGGVANGLDFSPPVFPTVLIDFEIDAIANHDDFLFNQLLSDDAHLLFSLDKDFVLYTPGGPVPSMLPPGTPPGVTLANGNVVGGSGEISYELGVFGGANAPDTQGLWASQAAINGMPFPDDLDGLEIWGPEPALTADTDKLSLRLDAATGFAGPPVSVFNGDGTPYIDLPTITAAVTSLLGPLPTSIEPDRLNLDALMVKDVLGEDSSFDGDPTGGGADPDRIIFSIDQIPDPADPDGYYATGSELFVLDAAGGAFFLAHGGHLWDHGYALSTFSIGMPGPDQNFGVFDIDAIEAVTAGVVPEPTTLVLAFSVVMGAMLFTRRQTA
ncbi:hypothetical protein [Adhaeretor mobilis]|uniref:PEP-CTERM protein-sorting domain-containing protein n=1 Tax=Adhaeretor mobilis TaxID=1930276 RepID=A0A517MUJ8_9BACT|nr:hypothetical protein [Adhaeretor mobilis]QDS98467.1 hypothetical protein HG15A2_17470 [Adhaeretor mobilis]